MRKNWLLCSLLSAVLFPVSLHVQAEFQDENSLSYITYRVPDQDGLDYSNWNIALAGVHYLTQVHTENVPLAEAAFLQQASSITLQLLRSQKTYDYKNFNDSETTKTDVVVLEADYYIPDTVFYVGAGIVVARAGYEYKSSDDNYKERSGWHNDWIAKLGIAPIKGLLIWSEFAQDVKPANDWNLNAKYVFPLSVTQAFNIEALYQHSDKNFVDYSKQHFVFDFYMTQRLGIGLGYVIEKSDDKQFNEQDNAKAKEIHLRNFFSENVSAALSYSEREQDKIISVTGAFRF